MLGYTPRVYTAMVLHMSRPHKNPKTGVYYFRQKTPADLRQKFGKAEVSWTLATKVESEAIIRNAEAVLQQAKVWQSLRATPSALPHKQLMALVGEYRRQLDTMLDEEPGEVAIWDSVLKLQTAKGADPIALEKWQGKEADALLLAAGLAADAYSRSRLIDEMYKAIVEWAEFQRRRSQGDYSPDPKADRFPKVIVQTAAPTSVPEKPKIITLSSLFDLWERDHLANGKAKKTADDFRQKFESLIAFIGHDDAQRVTGEMIADWCDHLRHQENLAAKTVRDKYLSAARVVFSIGIGKRKLTDNPTKGVKVQVPKKIKTRPLGFTDAEAKQILLASLRDQSSLGEMEESNKMAIRWVPWICAYSGARVSEITQLRKEDLIEEYGIACLRITPEAGSVKTGQYRIVPLHPHLIEMGLPQFIRDHLPGPLFYSPKKVGEDTMSRAKSAGKKVGIWVREVAGVTDPKVWPNHGWRHRFKTIARDVDIPPEYSDTLTGHEDGRASSDYGETTVKALWREIQKLPRYKL
jgi:integrase